MEYFPRVFWARMEAKLPYGQTRCELGEKLRVILKFPLIAQGPFSNVSAR